MTVSPAARPAASRPGASKFATTVESAPSHLSTPEGDQGHVVLEDMFAAWTCCLLLRWFNEHVPGQAVQRQLEAMERWRRKGSEQSRNGSEHEVEG